MTIEQRIEEPADQFPVGMRVLAVDDDPTCLLLLEGLLRKCKYHVTTRTHAIAALNLLRDDNNRFDLVISDVHMPDMDGFKLLEQVGLEMGLPVIMLSAYGDPKLVMKGITHGACDYLLKPVRIEELQIIWQHVIRKKRVDPKDHKSADNTHYGNTEAGQAGAGNGYPDQKSNKKRKDQVEDEDEDHDDNELENDDPSAQKKPRVVWSIELHRKFVAAVNHLGIDKAVPKRILELMNVEKLTRENVASHLQKYRLYLRRISCVQSQQANMAAAFGTTDPASYLRVNGMGGFNSLSGSPQFQNSAAFRSFQPNGMLGRLNSPASLGGIQRLPSQFSGFSEQGVTLIPGNSTGCILKGMPMPMPTSFELDQLQDSNNRNATAKVDDLAVFPVTSGLPDVKKTAAGGLSGPHLPPPTSTLMLEGHPVQSHSRVGIGNQSAAVFGSLTPDLSSHFSDRARGSDNWPVAIQSSTGHSDSYASYSGPQHVNSHLDDGASVTELPLSVTDYQYGSHSDIKPTWDSFATAAAPIYSSSHSTTVAYTNLRRVTNARSEFHAIEANYTVENSATSAPSANFKRGYPNKPQTYQLPNSVGSLEDLVSSMMK
uniref:Two-component response regulator n=1 Tax=Kalanchoe fedtschenkoi TaxID=63787 RepID=A0A7N1A2K7_KALFE